MKLPDTLEKEKSVSTDLEEHYRQVYSGEAQRYDQVRFTDDKAHSFNTQEQDMVCDLLGLKPGQKLVDVAGGTGRIAARLAKEHVQVTVLDLTYEMLRQAQARNESNRSEGLDLVQANARELPFEDGQFDGAIAIRFLHLFPIQLHRPFIMEMWRVLKPGGVLLVQVSSAMGGGVVLPWSRQALYHLTKNNYSSHLVWPFQIPRVFSGFDNVSVHGFWPFGGYALQRINSNAAAKLANVVARGWPSFFAWYVFVRAVKPAGPKSESPRKGI